MGNKLDFEIMIRKELGQKADEAKSSDEMFLKIFKRIKNFEEINSNTLKESISNTIAKRLIAVSLCGILIIGGMMFVFSDEVRAATVDTINRIKSIFILEKSGNKYNLVEKSTEDKIFAPICSITSDLSDTELTSKLGFNVQFPKSLHGGYKLFDKAESIGIKEQISVDVMNQLEADMFAAINNDTVFNSLVDFNPYRLAFGTYKNHEDTIFISMRSIEDILVSETRDVVKETKVGNLKAKWVKVVYPNYEDINENGIGKSNIYIKPNSLVEKYSLIWVSDGVEYILDTFKELELNIDEAVKIAESFMSN